MDPGYPKHMGRWRGVPENLDAATTWKDGAFSRILSTVMRDNIIAYRLHILFQGQIVLEV